MGNIGLIGLGNWGKNLLRNLHEIQALQAICDLREDLLEQRSQQFPGIRTYPSITEMLKDDALEAIAIASSAATHFQLARQALLAGKDVFVEKPMALTVAEGEELAAIAERKRRVLMIGHVLQYHPAILKLGDMIRDGELGKIQYVYSNRLNIGTLRTEEDILWSFAPHDISIILTLLGQEPVGVRAFGGDYLTSGIFDTTLTTLEFPHGVKGHIFVSWIHPFKEQKLIVVGTKGMAVMDDQSKDKLVLYPHRIEWIDGKIPVAQKAVFRPVPIDSAEPLRQELEHFVACVRTRSRPRTDGREGVRVLRVLEAAQNSLLRQGRPPLAAPPAPTYGADVFVHETAVVDPGVTLGDGAKVWHFSHLMPGTSVGPRTVIGQNVVIGPDVTVGEHCKIQNNVSLYKGVELEDEVFCGPSCVFTNVYNPRAFIERKHEFRKTVVRRGATIGANATVVCGVEIGRYAMIGAGAVVKADVQEHAVVAGVPARRIGWACTCGTTLHFEGERSACASCGGRFALDNEVVRSLKEEQRA